MPMMNEDMPMREEMPMRGEDESSDTREETISAFVPAKFFKTPPKIGKIEQVKQVDIDPETGDVQIQCVYGGDESENEGYEEAFDRAMPEESED